MKLPMLRKKSYGAYTRHVDSQEEYRAHRLEEGKGGGQDGKGERNSWQLVTADQSLPLEEAHASFHRELPLGGGLVSAEIH